jgi:hypothetical protein
VFLIFIHRCSADHPPPSSTSIADKENAISGASRRDASSVQLPQAAAASVRVSSSSSRATWPSVWSSIETESGEENRTEEERGVEGGGGGGGARSAMWWAAEVALQYQSQIAPPPHSPHLTHHKSHPTRTPRTSRMKQVKRRLASGRSLLLEE